MESLLLSFYRKSWFIVYANEWLCNLTTSKLLENIYLNRSQQRLWHWKNHSSSLCRLFRGCVSRNLMSVSLTKLKFRNGFIVTKLLSKPNSGKLVFCISTNCLISLSLRPKKGVVSSLNFKSCKRKSNCWKKLCTVSHRSMWYWN